MKAHVDLWNPAGQGSLARGIPSAESWPEPLMTWGDGRINAAAWAADGREVVVAHTLGVSLYDPLLVAQRALAAPPSVGQVVAYAQGSIFAATDRAVLRLHSDGTPPQTILPDLPFPVSFTFSPNAGCVAVDTGGMVQVYRLLKGELCAELPIVSVGTAGSLAFSFDGRTLAAITTAGIELWDVAEAQPIGLVGAGLESITGVAFEASGRSLIAVVGGRICRGKIAGGLLCEVLADGLDDVQWLATAASGAVAVVSGDQIYLWPTSISGRPLSVQGPAGIVQSLAFDPAGHALLAASDAELFLWDAHDGLPRERGRTHWGAVGDIAFAPEGRLLAAVVAGVLWQLDGSAEPRGIALPPGRGLAAAVALAPSGSMIVSASDTRLQAYDAGDGSLCYEYGVGVVQNGGLRFSADGGRLALVAPDGVQIRRAADGALLRVLAEESARADDVALSPDGAYVAALIGASVCLWDAQSGELCWSLDLPIATCGVDLAIGGGCVAVAAVDSVRVWQIADAIPLLTLHERCERVILSPDGSTLATAQGSVARLYHVTSGARLSTCAAHTDRITCLAFSADSRHLATGSRDGTVRLWANPAPSHPRGQQAPESAG